MCDYLNGLFDFNGDGHTDLTERSIGFCILDELKREEEKRATALAMLFEDDGENEDPFE